MLFALLPALLLSILCAVDLTADGSYVFLEVLRRMMFAGVIALAVGLVCVGPRASADEAFCVDERPAPWLVVGLIFGVLMLLLQSTIDIALFQPGPWCLATLAMGALAGHASGSRDATPSLAEPPAPSLADGRRRRCIAAISASATVAWVAAAVYPVAGVLRSEWFAASGDAALTRKNDRSAWGQYRRADAPVANFDYRAKEAQAFLHLVAATDRADASYTARTPLDAAIAAAPRHALSWLTRSRWLSSQREVTPADAAQAIDDFGRAVALNTNDVDLRVEYADLLARFGRRDAADAEVAKALSLDDQLDLAEPKRLALRAPARLSELRARAAH